jgi:hypothetical protein
MRNLPELIFVGFILAGFFGFIVYAYFNGKKNTEEEERNKKENKQPSK